MCDECAIALGRGDGSKILFINYNVLSFPPLSLFASLFDISMSFTRASLDSLTACPATEKKKEFEKKD